MANSDKVALLLAKLEQEVQMIAQMPEDNSEFIQSKAERYQQFLNKKSKVLSPNNYILMNTSSDISILLGKVKNNMKIIKQREDISIKRLDVLEKIDGGSRSRLKGFELFRLFLILERKVELQNSKCDSTIKSMHESLIESYFLLHNDIQAPPPLSKCHAKLLSSITDIEYAKIMNNIKNNYS